jgi:succinate dehydrogenase / fumarate reductase cytochrome b subunit
MKVLQFFSTSIGKKFLVAITGLFMVFFLLAHLAGNLEIFSGPKAVNQYAVFLRSMPKALWGFRILLLVSVFVHIYVTLSLTRDNRQARPNPYHIKKSRKATLASRTMMISGITVLVFVCYHLAHYTLGITNPEYVNLVDRDGHPHVYNMMVMGFSNPLVSGFYILAQVLLAFHLSHGVSSAARTLGVKSHLVYRRICLFGVAFAAMIAVLYVSIPFSVMVGLIPLDY